MGQGRILIVDDEVTLVDTLAKILRDDGFEVCVAHNGSAALQLMQQAPPDLVLLDIWLPEMDGVEILQTLQAMRTDVPVIMMSGHSSIETAVKVTKLGAFDYLEKPLSSARVLATVQRAFDMQGPYFWQRRPASHLFPALIGTSSYMNQVRRRLPEAWNDDGVVTILGERGSGKTLLARLIHNGSARREGPFIIGRCANMVVTAMAPLLFGCARAPSPRQGEPAKGYLECANGGTLFLDQIESLSLDMQRQLARVIAGRSMHRVGGEIPIPLNVRLIASCLTSIPSLQAQGMLYPALAAQLQGLTWELVPLRQHREDIPVLVRYFLHVLAREHSIPEKPISAEALQCLTHYHWPENVAELKRLTEQLLLTTATDCIAAHDLPEHIRYAQTAPPPEEPRMYTTMARQPSQSSSWPAPTPSPARRQRRPSSQRTLRRSVVLYGRGLQSGLPTGMVLSPLPPDSGLLFRNITTGNTFPGAVAFVTSTDFCTSLCQGHFMAKTVEHLLSSLHAYGITNLLIKIHDEVPIMDGSAAEFCQLIEAGGVLEQDAPGEEFIVDQCYSIGEICPDTKFILVEPYDGFRVTYRLQYPPPLGIQELVYEHTGSESYRQEIAPARTFGFVKEVEKLHQLGFLGGGRLNNVILIDNEKIVNNAPLRFPDEFVRHKILDIIGDLYLLGRPIRGHVQANMTGHTENVALVKKLQDIIMHYAASKVG